MSMKNKFLIFFTLISVIGAASLSGDWTVQYRVHGGIDALRALFEVMFMIIVLYLLWHKTNIGYILSLIYAAGNLVLSSLVLFEYLTLWRAGSSIYADSLVLSFVVIISAVSALILFVFDYLDYLKRRVPDQEK